MHVHSKLHPVDDINCKYRAISMHFLMNVYLRVRLLHGMHCKCTVHVLGTVKERSGAPGSLCTEHALRKLQHARAVNFKGTQCWIWCTACTSCTSHTAMCSLLCRKMDLEHSIEFTGIFQCTVHVQSKSLVN